MRSLAILACFVALACATPAKSEAHNLRGSLKQRAHHGATALLWLDRHRHAGDRARRRSSIGGHYWLLMSSLRRSGFFAGAVCVHSKEGSWQDTGAPHWGGMQMDLTFQRSHGLVYLLRWGTADHWPVWAQLHASFDAWTTRGWHPWPNTARACGLL